MCRYCDKYVQNAKIYDISIVELSLSDRGKKMNKKEFLKGLEEAMLEQMDIGEAAPHIRYYQEYIENEIRRGREEAEVIASLKNPRLVAKNIINNSKSANKYKSDVNSSSSYDYKSYSKDASSKSTSSYKWRTDGGNANDRDTFDDNYYENGRQKQRHGRTSPITFSVNGKPISSIWVKIALMAVVFVVLVVVFFIVSGVLWILLKIVLPLVIICGLFYLAMNIVKKLKR